MAIQIFSITNFSKKQQVLVIVALDMATYYSIINLNLKFVSSAIGPPTPWRKGWLYETNCKFYVGVLWYACA